VRTRSQILEEIQAVAAETLDWRGELSTETRLVEDLDLDSLRALTLVIEIENRLRVRIEPEDETGLDTIGDLLDVVELRQRDLDAG
jgi:acyl carrier protein